MDALTEAYALWPLRHKLGWKLTTAGLSLLARKLPGENLEGGDGDGGITCYDQMGRPLAGPSALHQLNLFEEDA